LLRRFDFQIETSANVAWRGFRQKAAFINQDSPIARVGLAVADDEGVVGMRSGRATLPKPCAVPRPRPGLQKIARSFNCGFAFQKQIKPRRGDRRLDGKLFAITAVPLGLGSFYLVNQQLNLRVIIVRRFATLTGGDCIRLIIAGFRLQNESLRFATASSWSDLG
jgi:hypothetical protein